MLDVVDFPELVDRTGRFSYGAPHAVTVGGAGARVVFLRSPDPSSQAAGLWVVNVATAAERLVDARGISSYAIDHLARVAAYAVDGRLFQADLISGDVAAVVTAEAVEDPQPDPTGRYIGYVTGSSCLRVVRPDGT